MKIEKFQKGKIIRRIIGDIAEEYLDKPSVMQKIFKNGPELPTVLKDLAKQYGDDVLTTEQAMGLEDFSRYLLTKDKTNLVFDPKTKLFSWQELPFEEAAETWKHLPVMQENPVIKHGLTERFVPIEVPYRGGTLKRVHFPKSGVFEPDRNIVSPHIQFEWHRTPFDSYERSFLKPIMGYRNVDGKIVYMPGHLYNMGLIPSHQAKSLYNLTSEGLDLSKMSRQGMFDTMKTVDDLVTPNASYLSGDFVRGLDANAHTRDIPIGAELMQRYNSDPGLLPREVMDILNRDISEAQFSLIGKNLSTDSFKLIGDFGHKGNNGLRFGGWQNGFNSLGTQNKYLIDLTDAFKRHEISKNEYADKIREWIFQSFPQTQNYNPEDLVSTPFRYSPDVYIRHPFGLKGFKKGGKIEKHQKGKIILNALEDLGGLVKTKQLKVKRPRISVQKPAKTVSEKVIYTPPVRHTAEDKQIFNAFQKYKSQGVYATMPEDQAWELFKQDWDFRHDPTRAVIKDLRSSIKHNDQISGIQTPDWMTKAMESAVKINPSAFRTDLPTNIGQIKYVSNPKVLEIPDFFSGHSYRGIGNYDTMFENAQHAYLSGAPEATQQFLSAGMKDVAAMARGLRPTSFKYKPTPGVVPIPVLDEIVARRGGTSATAEWLRKISQQDPTLGASYLDLFAKYPDYFKKMYNLDGTLIK